MLKVYTISQDKLGDRDFNEMSVADLQIEGTGMTVEEFQQNFNTGRVDARTEFIKFVSI